jgi:hypothetical protein
MSEETEECECASCAVVRTAIEHGTLERPIDDYQSGYNDGFKAGVRSFEDVSNAIADAINEGIAEGRPEPVEPQPGQEEMDMP